MRESILAVAFLIWGALSLCSVIWGRARAESERPVLRGALNFLLAACLIGAMSDQLATGGIALAGLIGLGLGALSGLWLIAGGLFKKK